MHFSSYASTIKIEYAGDVTFVPVVLSENQNQDNDDDVKENNRMDYDTMIYLKQQLYY